MVVQEYGLFGLKEIQYFFGRQESSVEASRMGRLEGLHQSDLFFYTLFTDIAGLLRIQPSFVGEQLDIAFAHNAFGVLLVPFSGCREQQIEVKGLYLFRIFKMWFKTFDEIVPEQQSVLVKEPGKTHMGERPESGKKARTFSLYFKVYKVPKL